MSLPKHFEFYINGYPKEKYVMLMIDGSYYCDDAYKMPTKACAEHGVKGVQGAVDTGLWIITKDFDIVERSEHNIPDHFTFNHQYTSQVYEMKRMGRDWECTKDGQGWGAYYTAEEIEQHIKERSWQNVKPVGSVEEIKEEEPVEQLKEPGLIFPFTFVYMDRDELYTATEADNQTVNISWPNGEGNSFLKVDVQEYIEEGLWIVKSVGEQPVKDNTPVVQEVDEAAEERYEPLPDYVGDAEDINGVADAIDNMAKAVKNLAKAYDRLARAKDGVNV